MNILNDYPGPWSISLKPIKGGAYRVELVDGNGFPVATIHGETVQQCEEIANLIKQVPEIFEKSNS